MRQSSNPILPGKVGRPKSVTPEIKATLLELVRKHGWNPGAMAAAAGCCLGTLYATIRRDSEFADDIAEAKGVFLASLEREAYRRAVEGVETVKSITKEGEPVIVRVYSDALLAKLLVANGPEKHGQRIRVDKRVSHAHTAKIDVASLPADDREALRRVLQRRRIEGVRGVEAHDSEGKALPVVRDDEGHGDEHDGEHGGE